MRKLWLLGLIVPMLISCKENETITPVDNLGIVTDYLPMKVGNYWVYRHYVIDTSGIATEQVRTDSVVITSDTMINGKQYFVFQGTNYPYNEHWGIIEMLKDSGDYIVNTQGAIKFSKTNFMDVLASKTEVINGDTVYSLKYRMERIDEAIRVPAGLFSVLNYKGTIETPMDLPGIPNPRYLNTYYSNEVGKVTETYLFLNHPNTFEKRLIRYKAER